MAVTNYDGTTEYVGMVVNIDGHSWLDGMYEEKAVVWNMETHEADYITFGYYGIDGHNLAGGSAKVDATPEVIQDILHTLKRSARHAFAKSVTDKKNEVCKGRSVVVVGGKKVKKGTPLTVFWTGERPTYRAQLYTYLHETETIAGCYTENGEKVWIKADYLKPTDKIKSPSVHDRKLFIKEYVRKTARELYGINIRDYVKTVTNK